MNKNSNLKLGKLFQLSDIEEERKYLEELNSPNDELSFHAEKQPNIYKVQYELFMEKLNHHTFGFTSKTIENLDLIIESSLSKEEAAVVYMYTVKVYNSVNCQLRSRNRGNLDKDVIEYVKLLNRTLSKLPSFDNNIVYREIRFPDEGHEKLMDYFQSKLNKTITFPAFTSCHIDKSRWSSEENEVQLIIKTKNKGNGKDLRKLSFNCTENEVLFKTNSTFHVHAISHSDNSAELHEI